MGIKFNFKFNNNAKFKNIQDQYLKESKRHYESQMAAADEAAKKQIKIAYKLRNEGIKTTTYVTIDPFDFIDKATLDRVMGLPKKKRAAEMKPILNEARNYALDNLKMFLQWRYDIKYHESGNISQFIQNNEHLLKGHEVVLAYNEKCGNSLPWTSNITWLLKACPSAFIFKDGNPALRIEHGEIVERDDKLIKKMDESSRILRYLGSVVTGGAASGSWMILILILLILLLIPVLLPDLLHPSRSYLRRASP